MAKAKLIPAKRPKKSSKGTRKSILSVDGNLVVAAQAFTKARAAIIQTMDDYAVTSGDEDIARIKIDLECSSEKEAKELLKVATEYLDAIKSQHIPPVISPAFKKITVTPESLPIQVIREDCHVELQLSDILADGLDDLASQTSHTTCAQLNVDQGIDQTLRLVSAILDQRAGITVYTLPVGRPVVTTPSSRKVFSILQGQEIAVTGSSIPSSELYSTSAQQDLVIRYLKENHLSFAKRCLGQLRDDTLDFVFIPHGALEDRTISFNGKKILLSPANFRRLLVLAYFGNELFQLKKYSELYGRRSGYPAKEFNTNCKEIQSALGISDTCWTNHGSQARRIDRIKFDTPLSSEEIEKFLVSAAASAS